MKKILLGIVTAVALGVAGFVGVSSTPSAEAGTVTYVAVYPASYCPGGNSFTSWSYPWSTGTRTVVVAGGTCTITTTYTY